MDLENRYEEVIVGFNKGFIKMVNENWLIIELAWVDKS